jgi:regulator of RNase E activity RraA
MAAVSEYVVHGDAVNKAIEVYQINERMLPGQIFEIVEKRLIKDLLDEIDKAKPQTVRFVNVEAILSGPHKVFSYAIFGGMAELADALGKRGIAVTGAVRDPENLPWNFVSRIDKSFKGAPTHQSSSGTR